MNHYCLLLLCLVPQSDRTPCDPMGCSSPGFSGHGTSQAGIMEWVAIYSSRGSYRPRDWTHVSCIGGWIDYHHESSWITSIQFKWSYENTVPFVLLHVFRLFFHLSFKYLVSISLTPPCHLSFCTFAEPIFLLLWPPSLTPAHLQGPQVCDLPWLHCSELHIPALGSLGGCDDHLCLLSPNFVVANSLRP